MKNMWHRQSGVVLLVSLIMLILITLMAVVGVNLGKGSLQTVGNMQQRNQVDAAIQETIEEIISTTRFSDTPNAIFLFPCKGVANTKCVDIDGDGVADVTVTIVPAPICVKSQVIPAAKLDLSKSEDAGCSVGVGQDFGVAGAVKGDSLCADSIWEIRAIGNDVITQASVAATQGIASRVSTTNIPVACS